MTVRGREQVRSETFSPTMPDVTDDHAHPAQLRVAGDGGRPWQLRFGSADARAALSLRVALEQDRALSAEQARAAPPHAAPPRNPNPENRARTRTPSPKPYPQRKAEPEA
jgi:hypothetical protein